MLVNAEATPTRAFYIQKLPEHSPAPNLWLTSASPGGFFEMKSSSRTRSDYKLGAGVKGLPGGHSEWEPPDPFPNSEVKLLSADDSVGSPHVKVGHCQAFYSKNPLACANGFFVCGIHRFTF